MLASVLPGLRELRAPLAAGYVWLLAFWLALGYLLPTAGEDKPEPIDRLYRLEPIVSSVGLAVVASVVAYLVGSIAIDLQSRIGSSVADFLSRHWRWVGELTGAAASLPLTEAGSRMLETWERARADKLRETLDDLRKVTPGEGARDPESPRAGLDAAQRVTKREATKGPEDTSTVHDLEVRNALDAEERVKLAEDPLGSVDLTSRLYLASNRDLLKTRLLDASQSLHSEIDRPDAEATFRMALWPPLAILVVFLAVDVSLWWVLASVVPVLLAWQSRSLRRRANDALVAAFVAREELSGQPAQYQVKTESLDALRAPQPDQPSPCA